MRKTYRNICYMVAIEDGRVTLYFGATPMHTYKIGKNELEADAVNRVINTAIKSHAYRNWRNICRIAGDPKEETEEAWLEFLHSDYVRLLRKLNNAVQLDIGGKF